MIFSLLLYAFFSCVGCACLPPKKRLWIRYWVWVLAIVALYLSWLLWDMFDEDLGGFQFDYQSSWGSDWALDGYSIWFVMLTLWMTSMTAVMAEEWVPKGLKEHLVLLYLIQALVLVAFCTLNAFVFLLALQAIILPMYFWLVGWGGEARRDAGTLWLIYGFMGSLGMSLAFAWLGRELDSFLWLDWVSWQGSLQAQQAYFIAVSLAMMVQLAAVPCHLWLPSVHTQAPSTASVLLASVVLKLGGYGWLRWGLPVAPAAARLWAPIFVGSAVLALLVFAFITLVQKDMKRLMAYASIHHVAWVVLALFIPYLGGLPMDAVVMLDAAMVIMFADGLSAAGLFLSFGMIYHRMHRREIALYGGLASTMPFLSFWFVIYVFAHAAWPGTLNFVGVWMLLMSTIRVSWKLALVMGTALMGSAAYMLWMYRCVFWGPVRGGRKVMELRLAEMLFLSLLSVAILFFGFYPRRFLRSIHSNSLYVYPYLYASKGRP